MPKCSKLARLKKLRPESLRSRLILLMLVTLVLVQLVSVLVYLQDRNTLISNAGIRLQVQRIANLISLMDQSEPYQYRAILKATETPQLAVLISTDALVPAGLAASHGALEMRQKLYEKTLRQPEQKIRVTYERYLLPKDFDCDTDEYVGTNNRGRSFQGENHIYWRKQASPSRDDDDDDHDDDEDHDDDRDKDRDKNEASDDHHKSDKRYRDFRRFGYLSGEAPPYELSISVLLPDQRWLNIRAGSVDELPVWRWRSAVGLVIVGFIVVAIMLWILRSNTRPLQKLARAANRIGRGMDSEPLAEEGAREVRTTIQAFNSMQERQQRFIKDRMLMLAAISHDLRTPITKLRLQSEFVSDEEIQHKMLNTLTDMEQMLNATMNFARDDVQNEPSKATDLASLVQSLCDDLIDQGAGMTCDLPERLVCECKPMGFRRMVSNVLENAVKYAESAHVVLKQETHSDTGIRWIVLTVTDDGPGIDEALFEQVFTPFYRVEGSRNRATGGMGLGLSVVRSIALLHGGHVALSNRDEGGLQVKIHIPC
ncbi:MAG: hypothetical protein CMI12_11860 [Oceanospirillum sp.]|nr:hypothetical protein [Oceanospirillum sp.]